MTRRKHSQLLITELVLFGMAMPSPSELLDPDLRKLDEVLDDEEILAPVVARLRTRRPGSKSRGRPSTPAEVVLRLLVLKHVRNWSYDRLQWEVTGNVAYRDFCRIGGHRVPDAKTMVRYGQLLDESILRPIFDRLVQVARERRITRGKRMRVDTTVVEAPIHYPTDSRLCEDGVRVLRRELERLLKSGVELGFKLRRVGRSVSRAARAISEAVRLRGDAAKEAIKKPYRKLLRITAHLVRQAERAVLEVPAQLQSLGDEARSAVQRSLERLATFAPRVRHVARQARARVFRGITKGRAKLISIFEPTAQILRRGKVHKPTEFGRLVKVQEAEGGIVTDIDVVDNVHDSALLVPSVEQHIRVFGRAPEIVATDRGFYSGRGVRTLRELGVKRPVIPKPGRLSNKRREHERQPWFQRGRAWRSGGEARISRLKHPFGMQRARYKGEAGMKRSVLWAGIGNNAIAIGRSSR